MKVAVFDRMEECTEAAVEQMLPLVSDQRREQALRYKHTMGRFCCLKSWLMMFEQVKNSTRPVHDPYKTPIEWQKMEYNEYGKPFLPGGPFFSISHCKTGIAVAVDEKPIGIDIESIRHADEELIARTMNADEQKQIQTDRDFTRLWTQKEAVVKAEGIGIVSFEQLQTILSENDKWIVESREKENYIYSIAYQK